MGCWFLHCQAEAEEQQQSPLCGPYRLIPQYLHNHIGSTVGKGCLSPHHLINRHRCCLLNWRCSYLVQITHLLNFHCRHFLLTQNQLFHSRMLLLKLPSVTSKIPSLFHVFSSSFFPFISKREYGINHSLL